MSEILDRRIRHYRRILRQLDETLVLLTLYEVGTFDALLEGEKTVAELADRVGASEHRMDAFLRLGHEYGLVRRQGDRYGLIPADRAIFEPETDQRRKLRLGSVEDYFGPRLAAPEILRTDEHAERAGGGDDVTEEERRRFLVGLHRRSVDVAAEVAEHLAEEGVERILDVGSGAGTYACELLERLPGARATLVDRPNAAPTVRKIADEYGLSDRVTFRPGDFFEIDLGSGFDLAIMSNIVHCFGPERNRTLVGRIREVLGEEGRLAVKDMRYPRDDSNTVGTLRFNLRMALYTERGRVYRRGTIVDWLMDAGFESIESFGLLESSNAHLLVAGDSGRRD